MPLTQRAQAVRACSRGLRALAGLVRARGRSVAQALRRWESLPAVRLEDAPRVADLAAAALSAPDLYGDAPVRPRARLGGGRVLPRARRPLRSAGARPACAHRSPAFRCMAGAGAAAAKS